MILSIYIPTRGRIGFNKQVTLREFLSKSSYCPVLVCPEDEVKLHAEYYPRVIAAPKAGIGPTRQFILESSKADLVIMVDDDMRFNYRPKATSVKLEVLEDLHPMIDAIKRSVWEKGFIHGGVSARQGNQHKIGSGGSKGTIEGNEIYTVCDRVNNFHFLDRKKVISLARFDRLPVMEDFHFTLSLLTQGYQNIVLYSYAWNQEGSGKEGGCSLYRTADIQSQGATGLKEAFPEFVRIVEKQSKETSPAWKDFKVRKDVVVQWMKAFKSSQE